MLIIKVFPLQSSQYSQYIYHNWTYFSQYGTNPSISSQLIDSVKIVDIKQKLSTDYQKQKIIRSLKRW